MNPVDWFAWIYGKYFLNHPNLGWFVVVFVASIFTVIISSALWFRAVDKYKEEQLKNSPAQVVEQKKSPPPVQQKSQEKSVNKEQVPQNNPKKKIIMDSLASFLSRATVIQNQCVGVGPPLPPGRNVYQEYADWHKELYDYINKELGYSYAVRMVDSLSILVPQPQGLPALNTKTWVLTEQSKVRVRELISKFE